jgi:hypothetical protein
MIFVCPGTLSDRTVRVRLEELLNFLAGKLHVFLVPGGIKATIWALYVLTVEGLIGVVEDDPYNRK